MSEKYEAQKRWDKDNLTRIMLNLTAKSGMPEALRKMEEQTGENKKDYIKRALKEQLEFDGWLKQE